MCVGGGAIEHLLHQLLFVDKIVLLDLDINSQSHSGDITLELLSVLGGEREGLAIEYLLCQLLIVGQIVSQL